jgi:hypothetical protein
MRAGVDCHATGIEYWADRTLCGFVRAHSVRRYGDERNGGWKHSVLS